MIVIILLLFIGAITLFALAVFRPSETMVSLGVLSGKISEPTGVIVNNAGVLAAILLITLIVIIYINRVPVDDIETNFASDLIRPSVCHLECTSDSYPNTVRQRAFVFYCFSVVFYFCVIALVEDVYSQSTSISQVFLSPITYTGLAAIVFLLVSDYKNRISVANSWSRTELVFSDAGLQITYPLADKPRDIFVAWDSVQGLALSSPQEFESLILVVPSGEKLQCANSARSWPSFFWTDRVLWCGLRVLCDAPPAIEVKKICDDWRRYAACEIRRAAEVRAAEVRAAEVRAAEALTSPTPYPSDYPTDERVRQVEEALQSQGWVVAYDGTKREISKPGREKITLYTRYDLVRFFDSETLRLEAGQPIFGPTKT